MPEKMTGTCLDCGGPCSRRAKRCRQCIQDAAVARRTCGRCGGPRDDAADLCRGCHHACRPSPYPPEMVEAVKRLYSSGQTQDEVAAELGTSQKVIWRLMRLHDIPRRPQVPRDQRGEKGHGYQPDSTNYQTLHSRVGAARGKPNYCSICGTTDEDAWYEWANLTGNYQDIYDYARMCVPCHRRFDAERRRAAA